MDLKRTWGVAGAAFAIGLLSPLQASAESIDRSYAITTRIVEQAPSVGEYDGSLELHVAPNGIVSGYYRPDDNPRFISVTGGVSGNQLWLDIGTFARRPVRFSGTFNNGKIVADGDRPIIDNGRYTTLELLGNIKNS
jgi:hypothetical protein